MTGQQNLDDHPYGGPCLNEEILRNSAKIWAEVHREREAAQLEGCPNQDRN